MIHVAKGKVMRCSRGGGIRGTDIFLKGEILGKVTKFRYLCVDVEAEGLRETQVSLD